MARSKKPRDQHRTDVVERNGELHAQIIVPIECLEWASRRAPTLTEMRRALAILDPDRPTELGSARRSTSIVFDPFGLRLFLTTHDDGIEFEATHDGPTFHDAAARRGAVDVFVTSGVDVRRSNAADLAHATRSGSMVGASVDAFAVQSL